MNETQNWRTRVGWLAGQLFIIFLGVSAAFLVENYRETASQKQGLRQAVSGIITELQHIEERATQFANAFNAATERWAAADREGRRAVPGYYRIPGSTHPPSAAWNTAITSGIVRMLDPKLRMDLGYSIANSSASTITTTATTNLRSGKFCRARPEGRTPFTDRTENCSPFFGCTWICKTNSPRTCAGWAKWRASSGSASRLCLFQNNFLVASARLLHPDPTCRVVHGRPLHRTSPTTTGSGANRSIMIENCSSF